MAAQELSDRAAEACRTAVASLSGAGIAPEALAEYVPGRRGLLRRRPATMRPRGEVWRVAPLLLGADGALYAAGRATRSAERGRPGYQSVSREERREIAAAALRGGYPVGAAVNFDAVLLLPGAGAAEPADLDAAIAVLGEESPIGVVGAELRVRWRAGAPLEGAPSLEEFLRDRVALLVERGGEGAAS
ncbi:hypothetical protein JD276_01705 [Leucobacter sp. CSA1]|uniref:Uncharacterized protein n=1 Tax=Leucobacter chromiisoli TaxID=2796471 RepID=A0A934UUA9_9MICO|nr:hypothetical protein [Leucobacter chromiisoli]MBK0417752.1 hypothetical protein [Leucobacter chromiisoli]